MKQVIHAKHLNDYYKDENKDMLKLLLKPFKFYLHTFISVLLTKAYINLMFVK